MPQAKVGRGRGEEASPEIVETLLSRDWRVLTADNGDYPITEKQKQFVALISSGNDGNFTLLIAKDYARHAEVSAVRSTLKRRHLIWKREFLVELNVISSIYKKVEGNPLEKSADIAQMQRVFIDLIATAARKRCSDVHLSADTRSAVIRVRSDGVMMKLQEMPVRTAHELCQAAFAMCDASDSTYMPNSYQGARVTELSVRSKGLSLPEGVQSIRLQFNPLPAGGRYMVARLLYSQKVGAKADIDELGYMPNQIRDIIDMRRKSIGINIISGPTGSGKSTTLQRSLTATMRDRPGINVITIEDPPEYVIEGAQQLPVTNAATAEERSEKFRQAIAASLRSDPNTIMIGEIRDGASAQLAFEAAMTGHGVWASLHANDAISILDRLRDQKIELYKLCDSKLITGLVGQRLIRRTNMEHALTFEEAVAEGIVPDDLKEILPELAGDRLGNIRFAGVRNLADPADAYIGRSVVAETIVTDQHFLDLYKDGKKYEAVDYWLEERGGMTMLEHAFTLVLKGLVCPLEVENEIDMIRNIRQQRVPIIMDYVGD